MKKLMPLVALLVLVILFLACPVLHAEDKCPCGDAPNAPKGFVNPAVVPSGDVPKVMAKSYSGYVSRAETRRLDRHAERAFTPHRRLFGWRF